MKNMVARLVTRPFVATHKGLRQCEGVLVENEREVQRVTTSYHQALDRAITVQAFARGWRERLVIQKLQKRKRAFWGTCLWTFRTMRFKRDRLAAYTLQCTLRELRSAQQLSLAVLSCS